ncbi:hypothetical protein FSZ31_07265 [Sphingorhabdus soli]|uniref:OmpA family protein n=1 Tax=Flavisphingopyxis soli TaxID=2601267 RepID=A0A5C6U9D2_9SPHN|nr:hypothetical protein [Sphingorhabdus soli]TXC68771.1 hypothetical protein FSZ31_07265 [Sphingorhabdus soli]
MSASRSMFGFVDLTLILLGSVALIGQLDQREARASVAIKPNDPEEYREVVSVALAEIFPPNEARVSTRGKVWLNGLAERAKERRLAVGVAIDAPGPGGRMNGWEQAAARTAAIIYALEASGYPEDKIEPQLPHVRVGAPDIAISIGE